MSNKIKTTSQLLFNEEPLVVNRLAAKVIGLNESIVIQQVHYWLEINRKAKINFHDGRTWTYNSIANWQKENFDFWSVDTVKRTFAKLVKSKILLKGNYNKYKYDKTTWYTIDYEKLDSLLNEYNSKNVSNVEIPTLVQNAPMSNSNISAKCPNGLVQDAPMDEVKMHQPIPETTTEISTEISLATQSEDKSLVVNTNKELIESNTHLLLDSDNKQKKVAQWKKDRLLKAIEIFKQREGQYFTLLEKIYKDDKNFVPKSEGSSAPKVVTRFHNINESFRNYTPEELEKLVKENQKGKFDNNDDEVTGANKSESKQELRAQAIKNVQANNLLTVIEGDPLWEKQIEDEIERLSNN